jgi:hypothetical protein
MKRQSEKRLGAKRRRRSTIVESVEKPGKASKYIRRFEELQPGDRVLICSTVSTPRQESHLIDVRKKLARHVKAVGAKVVGVSVYIGPRYDPTWIATNENSKGVTTLAKARRRKADVLLFESPDRAIRHPQFLFNVPGFNDLQATEGQLKALAKFACDIPIMTLIDPDAIPDQVESYRVRRGQREKGRTGGRPRKVLPGFKKRRKDELRPIARRLGRRGLSHRVIASEIGVPARTVGNWLK